MKVGIFSDTHLGFDKKGERNSESFDNLSQAIQLCLDEQVDFILLPGDVFDEPVPSHSSLFNAIKCFSLAKKGASNVTLVLEKNNDSKVLNYFGIPILTIHGNHEYRGKEFRTALDVLDLAGSLVYFHAGKIVVEKENERVCVFGLGAVPEKRALEVLQHWNPVPEKNACNIMITHQGFKDFMAIDDEMIASLSLEDLPKGFNLIVNGHLHWSNKQQLGETTFLLAGSTISTSIKKLESEKQKGVHFYDTESKALTFTPFPMQRKMFYHKIVFDHADAEQVLAKCNELLNLDLNETHELKPLIRLNLKGTLKTGLSSSDVDLNAFCEKASEEAILSLSKNFLNVSFKKRISDLREAQKSRLSVASMGFELLEKNLKETDFGDKISAKTLFDLLSEDELDKALDVVTKS